MRYAALGRLGGPSLLMVTIWSLVAMVPAALNSADDQLAAVEDEQALLVSELDEARALADELDALDGRIAAASVAVPGSADLAAFVRAVGKIGEQSGVAIEQIAPLKVASDSDPEALVALPAGTSSITISVGAGGSYEQAMAFAAELGRLERLVVVDLVRLTADEEDSSQVIIDLELRIFTTEQLVIAPQLDDEDLPDDGMDDPEMAGEEGAP